VVATWWFVNILVGIDVQSIHEVEDSLREFGSRYTRALFTDYEVTTCGRNPGSVASRLAGRFAAKEAVLKVLDLEDVIPLWTSIEVKISRQGRPEIFLHAEAADLASSQGIEHLSLSISHGGGIATAAVVAQLIETRNGVDQ
jgi:holo-[acyl-carrier protein] synthase